MASMEFGSGEAAPFKDPLWAILLSMSTRSKTEDGCLQARAPEDEEEEEDEDE